MSIIIFALGRAGIFNFLEVATNPIQRSAFNAFQIFGKIGSDQEIEDLKKENLSLTKKFVDQEKLKAEISAFRDQFETEEVRSNVLLPANIVGMKGFIPNVTPPENFILDKGESDSVRVNDAVIYQDNIVGRVSQTTKYLSKVLLVTASTSTFAARTEGGVLGIVKGEGNGEMVFQNVLLSETIKVGELVLTSGDMDLEGRGSIPNLIVGKIVSLEKNPSELFQKARLKPFIDYSKLSKVFLMRGLR